MSARQRNNVRVSGTGGRAMVFAHGFGCDQGMWRSVSPAFENDFRTVLFDQVGTGGSNSGAYDRARHSTLDGYAKDLVEIGQELDLSDAVFVGHSVSAMTGVLASLKAPPMFGDLVLVCPSPRYIDDGDYVGGFAAAQIDELLDFLGHNHMGWSAALAPAINYETNVTPLLRLPGLLRGSPAGPGHAERRTPADPGECRRATGRGGATSVHPPDRRHGRRASTIRTIDRRGARHLGCRQETKRSS